jgi:hypothetical protein
MTFHYVAIHEHEYGETIVRFTSPVDLREYFNDERYEKVIAKTLGLNFEPQKGESLRIIEEDVEVMELTALDVQTIIDGGEFD